MSTIAIWSRRSGARNEEPVPSFARFYQSPLVSWLRLDKLQEFVVLKSDVKIDLEQITGLIPFVDIAHDGPCLEINKWKRLVGQQQALGGSP